MIAFPLFSLIFAEKQKKSPMHLCVSTFLFKFAVSRSKCVCVPLDRHTLEVFSYSAPVNLDNSSLCNKNTRTPPEDLSHVLTLLAHSLVWAAFLILCTGSREPSGGIRQSQPHFFVCFFVYIFYILCNALWST